MSAEDNTTLRDQLEEAVDKTIVDPLPEVNAPETWTDEDKTYFNGISDPKARQWLVTRDTGYQKQITEANDKFKPFDEVFKPYDDKIKGFGQTREQVVGNLLHAQTVLETKPVEGIAWLVKQYKITPEQVLQALNIKAPAADGTDPNTAEDPYAALDPALAARMRDRDAKLDFLLKGNQNQHNEQVAQMRQNLSDKAKEFKETKGADGQAAYPYMTDQRVVDKMSQLLKSSIVKVEGGDVTAAYKNAYEQAVYSFPDIRDKLVATVDQDRVNKARRAGASPRPDAGASRATPRVGNSVREQLAAAYAGRSDNQ